MRNTIMSKYNFSITKGSLLLEETRRLLSECQLEEIFNNVLDSDFIFLPQNSESARKTIGSQLLHRIRSTEWLDIWKDYLLLIESDQILISFYSMCCRYELMRDFMLEVYRDKWLNMKDQLTKEDIYHFLEIKSDQRPELNDLQDYTRSKVVQVIYRTLNEARLLDKDAILDIEISSELKSKFIDKGEQWFLQIINVE